MVRMEPRGRAIRFEGVVSAAEESVRWFALGFGYFILENIKSFHGRIMGAVVGQI